MRFAIVISILVIAVPADTHAAFVMYTDEASFVSAIGSHDLQTFEDVALGPYGTSATFGDLTFSSAPSTLSILGSPHPHGAHNTTPAGSRYLFSDSGIPSFHDPLFTNNAGPMTAFGAIYTDLEVGGMSFYLDDVLVASPSVPGRSGAESFFGFVATGGDSFTTVRLEINDITYGIDDVRTVAISEPTNVLFDIKPGSDINPVNLGSNGVLPTAVLSTEDFDVSNIDVASLLFGDPLLLNDGGTAVSPLRYAFEDVSGDGLLDLTLKFDMPELVDHQALGPDSIEGVLTGSLLDGTPIMGNDSLYLVPPHHNGGNNKAGGLVASSVPEPTTLALAALGLMGVARCRRRRQ